MAQRLIELIAHSEPLSRSLAELEVRAVVQRAAWARVSVDGEIVGSLDGPGLVVLLG